MRTIRLVGLVVALLAATIPAALQAQAGCCLPPETAADSEYVTPETSVPAGDKGKAPTATSEQGRRLEVKPESGVYTVPEDSPPAKVVREVRIIRTANTPAQARAAVTQYASLLRQGKPVPEELRKLVDNIYRNGILRGTPAGKGERDLVTRWEVGVVGQRAENYAEGLVGPVKEDVEVLKTAHPELFPPAPPRFRKGSTSGVEEVGVEEVSGGFHVPWWGWVIVVLGALYILGRLVRRLGPRLGPIPTWSWRLPSAVPGGPIDPATRSV